MPNEKYIRLWFEYRCNNHIHTHTHTTSATANAISICLSFSNVYWLPSLCPKFSPSPYVGLSWKSWQTNNKRKKNVEMPPAKAICRAWLQVSRKQNASSWKTYRWHRTFGPRFHTSIVHRILIRQILSGSWL